MFGLSTRFSSVALTVFTAAAVAFSANCHALKLTKSTTKSSFKIFPDQDFVCEAADGEVDITASTDEEGVINFLMESARDSLGNPISQTCCEVPHDSGISVADCEAGNPSCSCGEFVLDQKVEDTTGEVNMNGYVNDSYGNGDSAESHCLEVTVDGNHETYRCVVNAGEPEERWIWQLIPADDATKATFCDQDPESEYGYDYEYNDDEESGGYWWKTTCGVAIGTPIQTQPGDFPPDGIVWQFDQYFKNGEIVRSDFQSNVCHTGSFSLNDPIQCEVSVGGEQLSLRSITSANSAIVEVDIVPTINGSRTKGSVPVDFLSTAVDGELQVNPNSIDTASIRINSSPVQVLKSKQRNDRNGDGFKELRTFVKQADLQHALFPAGDCVADSAMEVNFSGIFTDGRAWTGTTTANVVCTCTHTTTDQEGR
jgi:hypothetical protein